MHNPFVILTGASGSGKTAISDRIAQLHPEAAVFRFDSIGVPNAETMASYGSGYQPGGAWQRAMTLDWLSRIASSGKIGHPTLFEGQMRIAFIREGLQQHQLQFARIILVDCDDAERALRLSRRNQAGLADSNMAHWARYLREEARREQVEILDTTTHSLTQSTEHVMKLLEQLERSP